MADDLYIIAGLTAEQLVERAKSLALECEYWQQVLGYCELVNDAVFAGTTAVVNIAQSAAALALELAPARMDRVDELLEQSRLALASYKAIVAALDGTIDLAAGRQRALAPVLVTLRRAAGLDDDDGQAAG